MGKRRILPGELEIGSMLPWDAFDDRGFLLLRQGQTITTSNQVDRLIDRGLFAELDVAIRKTQPLTNKLGPSAVSPILEARRRLELICSSPDSEGFSEQILFLRELIAEACRLSPDAALATATFERHGRYSIRHSLDVAITCHVVGGVLEMEEDALCSIVAAALTMNLSILGMQDSLQGQKEPLTPEQRDVIERHPADSAAMLSALGVTDELWLETVLSHHEAIDGSGYGQHKKGDEIALSAQLVSLSDIYCARISTREYRRALRPSAALRALFLDQGKKVSPALAGRFIKAIGVFPAGSPVRLENGEIAVVTERGESANMPQVTSIVAPEGMPLVKPIRRDTREPAWRVREVMEWSDVGAMPSMHALWGKVGAIY